MFDRTKLLADLEEEEGLRLVVYDDATGLPIKKGDTLKGNPTFGIGFNLSVALFTPEQIRTMLGWVVDAKGPPLYRIFPWLDTVPEPAQRAIADMDFQMSPGQLQTFTTFISLVQSGKFSEAADDLETSTLWFRQVGQRGPRIQALLRQAEALA